MNLGMSVDLSFALLLIHVPSRLITIVTIGRRYFMFYLTPSKIDGIQNAYENGALLADYLEKVHPYYDCKQADCCRSFGMVYLRLTIASF